MSRDTAWYSILDDEWPEIREKIGSWLDLANFDSDGKPRTSLSEIMEDRTPGKRRID